MSFGEPEHSRLVSLLFHIEERPDDVAVPVVWGAGYCGGSFVGREDPTKQDSCTSAFLVGHRVENDVDDVTEHRATVLLADSNWCKRL